MSSGGSAERMLGYEDAAGGGDDDDVGVATAEAGDDGAALDCELWARRCGRRRLSRGIIWWGAEEMMI